MTTRDDIGASKERQEYECGHCGEKSTLPHPCLKSPFKHLCPDWDFPEIDETCPEFACCTCFPKPAQPKESVQPQLPPLSLLATEHLKEGLAQQAYRERERQLLTALAELATLRAERAKMVEVIRAYRRYPDQISHWVACKFRKYPDWKEPQDDRCSVCKLADSLLPPEPTKDGV